MDVSYYILSPQITYSYLAKKSRPRATHLPKCYSDSLSRLSFFLKALFLSDQLKNQSEKKYEETTATKLSYYFVLLFVLFFCGTLG